MKPPAQSLAQKEASALTLLRNGYAQGLSDADCIAWVTAAMGQEHAGLIGRVWEKRFKTTEAN